MATAKIPRPSLKPAPKKVAARKAPAAKKAPAKKAAPARAKAKPTPAELMIAAPMPVAAEKPAKPKQKLVRDSFTMPRADFDLIDQMKQRALGFQRPAKKSELLRAGLQALAALGDAQLKAALEALPPLKPGRPKAEG